MSEAYRRAIGERSESGSKHRESDVELSPQLGARPANASDPDVRLVLFDRQITEYVSDAFRQNGRVTLEVVHRLPFYWQLRHIGSHVRIFQEPVDCLSSQHKKPL